MTELIYLTDSYKKELKARVVSVTKKGDHWEIVLDQTIFYPVGGGQPSDKGKIVGKNGRALVKHVRLVGEDVLHEASLDGELTAGDEVTLHIDWDLRFAHMRVHSAGHIVHEAVKLVNPSITPLKGEHGSDPYIEYVGSLTIDKKYQIEQEANDIVNKNLSLVTELVSLEELMQRSAWVPAHLPKNKPLRILTVGQFAPIPDGGTQVNEAREVGPIIITEIKNDDDKVQVHYQITKLSQKEEQKEDMPSGTISAAEITGQLLDVQQAALQTISTSDVSKDLLRIELLGAKSEFLQITKKIKLVPPQDKQSVGIVINQVKQKIEDALSDITVQASSTPKNTLADVTIPGHVPTRGHLHPTTIVVREMNDIFQSMGFSVAEGPEIDTDEYNCDRVNLPPDHPARDLQDTLFIEDPTWLLRTHTSSVEAHILEKEKPPYRFVVPGKVYRQEKANATNNIMFYQYQGLAISTDITMAHLRGTLDTFVRKFFGPTRQTRFRCKYYPEVEPGVGVDISCAFCDKKGCNVCKYRGWIEMLGAGMVHPNMLRRVGLDPAVYSGFAWGMGLDRIVMQRYGISDIRSLYNGDISYKETL
jgi:phenylalanyl-tRNA synthetase alpha chain